MAGNLYLGSLPEIAFDRKEDRDREDAAAKIASKKLASHDELQKLFRIEKASFGFINSMPESLFVELRSKSGATIDAAGGGTL